MNELVTRYFGGPATAEDRDCDRSEGARPGWPPAGSLELNQGADGRTVEGVWRHLPVQGAWFGDDPPDLARAAAGERFSAFLRLRVVPDHTRPGCPPFPWETVEVSFEGLFTGGIGSREGDAENPPILFAAAPFLGHIQDQVLRGLYRPSEGTFHAAPEPFHPDKQELYGVDEEGYQFNTMCRNAVPEKSLREWEARLSFHAMNVRDAVRSFELRPRNEPMEDPVYTESEMKAAIERAAETKRQVLRKLTRPVRIPALQILEVARAVVDDLAGVDVLEPMRPTSVTALYIALCKMPLTVKGILQGIIMEEIVLNKQAVTEESVLDIAEEGHYSQKKFMFNLQRRKENECFIRCLSPQSQWALHMFACAFADYQKSHRGGDGDGGDGAAGEKDAEAPGAKSGEKKKQRKRKPKRKKTVEDFEENIPESIVLPGAPRIDTRGYELDEVAPADSPKASLPQLPPVQPLPPPTLPEHSATPGISRVFQYELKRKQSDELLEKARRERCIEQERQLRELTRKHFGDRTMDTIEEAGLDVTAKAQARAASATALAYSNRADHRAAADADTLQRVREEMREAANQRELAVAEAMCDDLDNEYVYSEGEESDYGDVEADEAADEERKLEELGEPMTDDQLEQTIRRYGKPKRGAGHMNPDAF